jgi:hypothetical protein
MLSNEKSWRAMITSKAESAKNPVKLNNVLGSNECWRRLTLFKL